MNRSSNRWGDSQTVAGRKKKSFPGVSDHQTGLVLPRCSVQVERCTLGREKKTL